MATFDFSAALTAKASGNSAITAGIHDATLVSIDKSTITTKNGDSDVMQVVFNIDGASNYTQNFFKPNSTERTKNNFGGDSPSQMEQFSIIVRQILEAVNPNFAEDVANGTLKIAGNFSQIVNTVKTYCAKFPDATFKVKFIPANGFNNISSYPARIDRNGNLRFDYIIGQNVTLTPAEVRKIKAAEAAQVTDMPASAGVNTADLLGAVSADMPSDIAGFGSANDGSNLPF